MEVTVDLGALIRALSAISDVEADFTERFYQIFFERRPDTRSLFGLHSLSEQEEMMRETVKSLVALAEGEAWLGGNLSALGASHEEYGVTADMYPAYVDTMLACALELLGEQLGAEECAALRGALNEVTTVMLEAANERGEGQVTDP